MSFPFAAGFWQQAAATGGYDADAAAFFSAAGITDNTQKTAVNQLVLDIKAIRSGGVWTNASAIYPFVGGTSTTHKYNLRNTATNQITWNGTVTHNSNGITGDGSTGYGDTGLNLNTTTANSLSFGFYQRTNSAATSVELSAGDVTNRANCIASYTGVGAIFDNLQNLGRIIATNSDPRGLTLSSRVNATDHQGYVRGSSIGSTSTNQGSLVSGNFFVLARNAGSADSFSDRNLALVWIGDGLSSSEVSSLTTAVTSYQTTLSRNV